MKLDIMIKKIEEFFIGEVHEANESYKFHLWKQEASESIVLYSCSVATSKKKIQFLTVAI